MTHRVLRSDRQAKGFAARLLVARKLARRLSEPAERVWSFGNEFASTMAHDRLCQGIRDPVRVAEVQSLSRLQFGRADWDFAPAGPLGFLAGRRPLISVRLSKMAVSFGV